MPLCNDDMQPVDGATNNVISNSSLLTLFVIEITGVDERVIIASPRNQFMCSSSPNCPTMIELTCSDRAKFEENHACNFIDGFIFCSFFSD